MPTPTINLNDGQPMRVKLVSARDPYTQLAPGATGTATFIDSAGTLHVTWDDGARLGLIIGTDRWQWINADERNVAELEQLMTDRVQAWLPDNGYSFFMRCDLYACPDEAVTLVTLTDDRGALKLCERDAIDHWRAFPGNRHEPLTERSAS